MHHGHMQNARPVSRLINTLKQLEKNQYCYGLAVQAEQRELRTQDEERRISPSHEPRRPPQMLSLFRPAELLKPEYDQLHLIVNADALKLICEVKKIFDWIFYGYDDSLKAETMARLHEQNFLIKEIGLAYPDRQILAMQIQYGMIELADLVECNGHCDLLTHDMWEERNRQR